jgi:hypothetical protein
MAALVYFGIKFVAYSLWCLLGLRLYQPSRASRITMAIGLGALRSFLGLGFGLVIWLVGSMVYGALSHLPAPSVLTYLLVYVPVRWLEWSIMLVIVCPSCRSAGGFFLGLAKADRLWRVGGIVLSCLSDIPMIVSLGGILPVGRFMC